MGRASPLKRKSFFIEEAVLREARRALHVRSDAEAIRVALRRVADMERFWRFMSRTGRSVQPGSFDRP